jgi:hypothetical protein
MGRDYLATPSTDLPPTLPSQSTKETLTLNTTDIGKSFRSKGLHLGNSPETHRKPDVVNYQTTLDLYSFHWSGNKYVAQARPNPGK